MSHVASSFMLKLNISLWSLFYHVPWAVNSLIYCIITKQFYAIYEIQTHTQPMDGKSRPRLASGPDIGKTISYLLVICISGMAIKAPISPQGVIIIVDKSRERERERAQGQQKRRRKKNCLAVIYIDWWWFCWHEQRGVSYLLRTTHTESSRKHVVLDIKANELDSILASIRPPSS